MNWNMRINIACGRVAQIEEVLGNAKSLHIPEQLPVGRL